MGYKSDVIYIIFGQVHKKYCGVYEIKSSRKNPTPVELKNLILYKILWVIWKSYGHGVNKVSGKMTIPGINSIF